ncbi:type III secretion system chaperone [Mesorhizobium sp. ANAO-SY3R2]|uniref:type III secretion system chaperone n=1 Tax=Mesorhizobium sp. ANAO-SY3R2 TaxID=3166644 RepID=UPI003671BDD0
MSEVGALDDTIVACIKTPNHDYAIRFDDLDVLVEVEADRGRVVLSCEIGTPLHARAAEVYETMLSYNLLWRATGGLRLALTGRGGAALQLADLAGEEINARQIATVAVNLAGLTRIWQAYLDGEADDRSLPLPYDLATAIRA